MRFRDHRVVGDIVELAHHYSSRGADELVFYDITASPEGRTVNRDWIRQVAAVINIPFCVAGGIRSVTDAEQILSCGADKISVNSPALANPDLISALASRFGTQCVVVGIDSLLHEDDWLVCRWTGDSAKTVRTSYTTRDWINAVQNLGAGEIVLNCMNQDGVMKGYDIAQIDAMLPHCDVPLVASGGAGAERHFHTLFTTTHTSAALAASVFHDGLIDIRDLKQALQAKNVEVRL